MFYHVLFYISRFFRSGYDILKQTTGDNSERSRKDNVETDNEKYLTYLIETEPSTSFEVESLSSPRCSYNEYY